MDLELSKEVNAALFSVIITYASVLVILLIFKYSPPKDINAIYGHRTKRAMKNQSNWDFANRLSPRALMVGNFIFLLLGLMATTLVYWNLLGILSFFLLYTVLTIICLFGPIIYTERKLKAFEISREEK